MSAWDRSQSIPWSRIEQNGEDSPEKHREKVWRELKREALLEQEQLKQQNNSNDPKNTFSNVNSMTDSINAENTKKKTNILGFQGQPFVTGDCFKQTLFGLTLGSITGGIFGFMDGMRQAGESTILKKASNQAKAKFLFQGTTRSSMLFGVFFGSFHTIRYGVRVAADPGDYTEIAIAGATSLGAMMARPTTRASLPYACMLVLMDSVQTFMN